MNDEKQKKTDMYDMPDAAFGLCMDMAKGFDKRSIRVCHEKETG